MKRGSTVVRRARLADASWLQRSFPGNKPEDHFRDCLRDEQDDVVLLVTERDGIYLGHCKLRWRPSYPYFADNGIPETQDLNVIAESRRQGIASALVDEAERRIAEISHQAGIRVGLFSHYGPAQRMYVSRGYVPDGLGASYHGTQVGPGEWRRFDDDLAIGFVKQLR